MKRALVVLCAWGLVHCKGTATDSGESAPGNTTAAAQSGAAAVSASVSATAAPRASSAKDTPVTPSLPPEEVQRVTNPGNTLPYDGPRGSVSGRVRMTGDPAPLLDLFGIEIPAGNCDAARKTYRHVFREGPDRSLADVLVAVTQYKGYLPPPARAVQVQVEGCAFDRRTIAMMFGQTLRVRNLAGEAATPHLIGASTAALLVAIPGGDPVDLHAQKVGLHRLLDRSHQFAFADVYVLPYPSFAVTGLDGRFKIEGLPVGKAKLDALLPATQQTLSREIEIAEGKDLDVGVLELKFDGAAYAKQAAELKSTIKPLDPEAEAERRRKAKLLADELVQTARGASTAAQSGGAATSVVTVPGE
jgi:hypothetical protein